MVKFIVTDLYKDLSTSDKRSIQQRGEFLGSFSVEEYVTKSLNKPEAISFILTNFEIYKQLETSEFGDTLVDFIAFLYRLAVQKTGDKGAIRFWFIDTHLNCAINISFSVHNPDDIKNIIISLKPVLKSSLETPNVATDKVLWLGYYEQNSTWEVTRL